MDAIFRLFLLVGVVSSIGAGYRTPNFVVNAPTAEFAKQVGDAAEVYRRELAIEWIGKPLPGNWKHACPIAVTVGSMGAGGKTTFNFQAGEVYGWNMEIQGSEQRILDSVLPHEINHTIFASHFRRPLPRWADEGAASLIEHDSERNRLREIHNRALGSRRKIPLKSLLEIKQYPTDQQDVLTLYAEGHSLADYLVQKGGKPLYIRLMTLSHDRGWDAAFKSLYGVQNLDSLERDLDQWVLAGSPKLNLPDGVQLASNDSKSATDVTIRAQSPESSPKLGDATSVKPAIPTIDRESRISQGGLRRSRNGLQQPLLVINKQTTDAAKVANE